MLLKLCAKAPQQIHRGVWGHFQISRKTPSIRHHNNYPLNVLILHPVVFLSRTSDLYKARFSIVAVIKTKYVSSEDKYGKESEDAGVQI